jgi:polar amino acid transport system substrate-binding protein
MGWTRREFLRTAAAVSGAAALAGCADPIAGSPRAGASLPRRAPSTTRPPRRTKIRIGAAEGRPFAFKTGSGEFSGQVVEVVKAVLGELGNNDVEFVLARFDVLPAMLAAGQVQLIGGTYINRNACRGITFSVPDHIALTAFAVPKGNPKGLKTYAEVVSTGAKLAVLQGLPEQAEATRLGVPASQIKAFTTPDLMLRAVVEGQADCVAFNDLGLRGLVADRFAQLEVTSGFTPDGSAVLAAAFGFPKTKSDLLDSFNTELKKLQESGEWLKISEPYGFTEQNVPAPDLTAEKLCAG